MSMPVQKVGVRVLRTALTAAGGVGLAIGLIGCNEQGIDPQSQIGSRPALPDIKQYLFPPMNIARVVGWKDGEAPSAASGLRIKAFAAKLAHPRSLYVLPNGDVLVVESVKPKVEPIKRPKDLIMGWIESMATGGGDKESNRITLLRDADGDGVPEVRSVFLDHLNSPFGVALVGDALYVAETDAITDFLTPPARHI